jgi:hypothetical protein
MDRLVGLASALFWGGVATLVSLAVIVFVLRVARNRLPVTAGVANTVAHATGLGV